MMTPQLYIHDVSTCVIGVTDRLGKKHGGGTVAFWGCFATLGPGQLVIINRLHYASG